MSSSRVTDAASLTNLGANLLEIGKYRAAMAPTQEAVDIYRGLAQAAPAAYRRTLADAQNNLAMYRAKTILNATPWARSFSDWARLFAGRR